MKHQHDAAARLQLLLRAVILTRWEQESIESIEHDEEGWTILLKPGYRNSHADSHMFRAQTRREAIDAFRWWVMGCNCSECKAARARPVAASVAHQMGAT